MKLHGSCLCGSVEFSVTDINRNMYQCHCTLCRKQGGSASNSATIVPLQQVEWLKGKDKIHSWVKDTGFRSDFCSICGSAVPNPLRGMDYYWIPVGTLDDAPFTMAANIYVGSKASWGVVATTGAQFETAPEFAEFIPMLASNGHI